ncbi:MAG: hypothetical protein HYV08_18080 [Deltaproteobacteria bacterium]|nr:hypothetical protein [Deltaproteobacteria bacterium]MBI3079688.1 hypothetical protein [Deltaproteobacteria bacterium]
MVRRLLVLMCLVALNGCATTDTVLFVTKTSLGIDFDSKPPSASIGYDRIEGYLGPRYDSGAVPPVLARIQTDGKIFSPRVRQIYATGAAASLLFNQQKGDCPDKLSGEKQLMFFGTTTTTGLKATFVGTLPDSFHFGHKRKELSLIPLGQTTNPAGEKVDVYPCVLATLDNAARAGDGPTAGLQIGQLFATGTAADSYARDEEMRTFFKSELADALLAYRATTAAQEAEATRILRCYLGVPIASLPEVWAHAHVQRLFREATLEDMMKLHGAATAPGVTLAVREENLRKANRQYASEIAILEGAAPARTAKLIAHRFRVCEIARR